MKLPQKRYEIFLVVGSGAGVAGVVEHDFVAEAGVVDVQIDLCGGDGFVAEHLLYGAQVGAAFQEVCGE